MLRPRFLGLSMVLICMVWSDTAFSESVRSTPLPSVAESAVSAAMGRDLRVYYARAVGDGLRLENANHGLTAHFDAAGVKICSGRARLQLHLLGYGHGSAMNVTGDVVPRADLNRVEYRRDSMTEWYVNGPLGLEQGFTVNRRPAGAGDDPVTVALAVSGDLVPVAGKDGIAFAGSDGPSLLHYAGLTAYDAEGRELPAWAELRGRQLLLQVDDRAARYPVVIDPWIQRAKLTASDGQSGDMLGSSVAISGDTVVVGSPLATINSNGAQGAVYVFVKPGSGWQNMTEVAKLTASDGGFEDQLGLTVDLKGDTIVAGAIGGAGGNVKPGATYVFVRPATGWKDMTETAELLASDGQPSDQLGWSVSLSGKTVAAGAIQAGGGGRVYVFVKPAQGWKPKMTQVAELSASDEQTSFGLGGWVAIDHDTVVAGAEQSGINGNAQGAAYVYVKPAQGWKEAMTENAKLVASDGQPQDLFGASVYVEGNTIVAGAPRATVGSNKGQGAGYIFVKPTGGWKGLLMQTAKLRSSDGQAGDELGWSASIAGNTLALGAVGGHVKGSPTGAVYIYVKPATGWKNMTQKVKLVANDGMADDSFGSDVYLSGKTLAVGAPFASVQSQGQQGAAYVFQHAK